MFGTRAAGVTLIELLVALVVLSTSSVALLTGVNAAITKQSYAHRRALVLAALEDKVDTIRSNATGGTINVGTVITHLPLSGIEGQVTYTETITAIGGYTDLYTVQESASWTETAAVATAGRLDSMTLVTIVRTNDT